MNISEIKKEMLSYSDFHGGDLIGVGDIKSAKTKEELAEIIDRHNDFLQDQLSDAQSHLQNLKQRLGL